MDRNQLGRETIRAQRLSSMFASLPDAFLTTDEDGVIHDWNAAATKMFGYEAEDIVGRNVSVLIPGPSSFYHDHFLSTYQSTHSPKIIGKWRQVNALRWDGSRVSVEITGSRFVCEGQVFFGGLLREVESRGDDDEKGLVEAGMVHQILELDWQLAAITDALPLAVICFDLEVRYQLVNATYARWLGCTREDIVGKALSHVLKGVEYDRILAILEKVMQGEIYNSESEYSFSGKPMEIRISAQPHYGFDGTVIGAIVVLVDITAEKAERRLRLSSEAVIAANEAKSAFLAHMSHEIRTPLSAIIGFSELIVGDNLPRQDKSTYLSAMRRNSKALSRIIADILDLSKVEAGSIELELKDVDLRAVVRDIETMFRPRAREKGIDFEIRLSEHIPLQINTDPARLFQILANLIGNALKFTEHGRIELSIFMTQVEGGERLIFDVTDTGLGMTEVEAKDLFKPFVRSITAQKRGFRGTGLGLVLSRRLAQALGGDVTLQQSKAGVGSTFSLWLHSQGPQDSQEAAAQEVLSMPSPSNEGLAGVSVLLAEDSFDIQLLIQTLLSKSGATVDTANNGIEAVEKASRKTYDVILMDLQMPEMDGYQAVKILRSRAYPGSIIALSAHAMKEEELRSIESGFDAHQCKPFDRQRLIAIVAQYSKMP